VGFQASLILTGFRVKEHPFSQVGRGAVRGARGEGQAGSARLPHRHTLELEELDLFLGARAGLYLARVHLRVPAAPLRGSSRAKLRED
jgi:hypothetical protein